jgi:hypothetical protein
VAGRALAPKAFEVARGIMVRQKLLFVEIALSVVSGQLLSNHDAGAILTDN